MNKETFDSAIPLLIALVEKGTCPFSPVLDSFQPYGLWHCSVDNKTLIASEKLLFLLQHLRNMHETVAAILACDQALRRVWSSYVAMQLKDAGQREDLAALLSQISSLGLGADAVQQSLTVVHSEHPEYENLEMQLLGCGAEQSAALPKLLRILNHATRLMLWAQDHSSYQSKILSPIAPNKPETAWLAGRLLGLPGDNVTSGFVLNGALSDLPAVSLDWLVGNPWGFLLAQLVYVQDLWRSEQIAGGLRLELGVEQKEQFYHPGLIQVVVVTREEQEVRCGSLGEFLCRVLKILHVALLTSLPVEQQAGVLDQKLGFVIGAMLDHSVWRFHQGNKQESSNYRIHPDFEPIPNRRLGTIQFARPGQRVAGVMRQEAEQWAYERLNKSVGNIR